MARPGSTLPDRTLARAIGRVVRERRTARGLSQEAFALLAGFHRTQVGFIERGERTPSVNTVADAARALNVRASDLLREAGY